MIARATAIKPAWTRPTWTSELFTESSWRVMLAPQPLSEPASIPARQFCLWKSLNSENDRFVVSTDAWRNHMWDMTKIITRSVIHTTVECPKRWSWSRPKRNR